MPRSSRTAVPPVVPPSLPAKQAIHLLQQQVAKGEALLASRPITSAIETGWETVTKDVLLRAFGSTSPHIDAVMSIRRYSFFFGGGSEPEWEEDRAKRMKERIAVICDLLDMLRSSDGISCPAGEAGPFRLDQVISRGDLLHLVRADFEAGKFEAAVFAAFRYLEESVRAKAKQPASMIGVSLMSAAFGGKGVLAHPDVKVDSEAEAIHQLMRGAIGWYKNPSSHRTVSYSDPQHAVQVLGFDNLLLDLLDQCA